MKIGRRFLPPNAIKRIKLNGYRRLTHLRCSVTVVFLCASANLGVTKRPVTALRHLVDLLDFAILSPPFWSNGIVKIFYATGSAYRWPAQLPQNSWPSFCSSATFRRSAQRPSCVFLKIHPLMYIFSVANFSSQYVLDDQCSIESLSSLNLTSTRCIFLAFSEVSRLGLTSTHPLQVLFLNSIFLSIVFICVLKTVSFDRTASTLLFFEVVYCSESLDP